MTAPHAQQIIDGYLARLEAAAGSAAPGSRADLLAEVTSHIAEARADMADESDADVLNILDRLGEPAALAAEMSEGAAGAAPGKAPADARGRIPAIAVVALLVICVGPLYGGSMFPAVGPVVIIIGGLLGARASGIWWDRDLLAAGTLPAILIVAGFLVEAIPGHNFFLDAYIGIPSIAGVPAAIFLALRARKARI